MCLPRGNEAMRIEIYSVMTREAFIKVLGAKGYPYEIEGDKIIVTHKYGVNLKSLDMIPAGVHFNNKEDLDLGSLISLPPRVEFNTEGNVYLNSLKELSADVRFNNGGILNLRALEVIPSGVQFNNGSTVYLYDLTSLPSGVVFKNGDDVYLNALIGGSFSGWNGNIEGIDSKRLLNKMIKDGVFER